MTSGEKIIFPSQRHRTDTESKPYAFMVNLSSSVTPTQSSNLIKNRPLENPKYRMKIIDPLRGSRGFMGRDLATIIKPLRGIGNIGNRQIKS